MLNTLNYIQAGEPLYVGLDERLGKIIKSKATAEAYCKEKGSRRRTYSDVLIAILKDNISIVSKLKEDDILREIYVAIPQRIDYVVQGISIDTRKEYNRKVLNDFVDRVNKLDIFPYRSKNRLRSALIRLVLKEVFKEED